ncbi:MAG: SRPBCC family protein [Gemmatimonadota bacterium]|nr:SRPBCC family protein [Gemmatimonadota bacterium]
MRWVMIILAAFAVLVLVVVITGLLLPQSHVASRWASYQASPATVWAAITDVSAFPSWRPDVKTVELLSAPDAPFHWRELGERPITFEQIEAEAPRRLVIHIADRSLPFGGGWTYELSPADGGGTVLNVTEHGEV